MKVAISIGHNPDAPGKTVGQYSEYSEMAVVAGFVTQILMYHNIRAYLVGTGRLSHKVASINDMAPDLAVELHLNAGGGDGSEVLYCPDSDEGRRLAADVQSSIVQLTGERDRGTKAGWYKMDPANGPDYFLAATNCPAVIVEGYFLDYIPDQKSYAGSPEYYQKLAFAVANGIVNYLQRGN